MSVQSRLFAKLKALGLPPPKYEHEWRHLARIAEFQEEFFCEHAIAGEALAWIEREELRLRIRAWLATGVAGKRPAEPTAAELADHPGLSSRLRELLREFGVRPLSELRSVQDHELSTVRGVGVKLLKEFRDYLSGLPAQEGAFCPDI